MATTTPNLHSIVNLRKKFAFGHGSIWSPQRYDDITTEINGISPFENRVAQRLEDFAHKPPRKQCPRMKRLPGGVVTIHLLGRAGKCFYVLTFPWKFATGTALFLSSSN